jgi:hypothetical protein
LHISVAYPIPGLFERECTDHAISCTNTREVDLIDELDGRWLVRILVTAVHLERVDSVLVDAL